MITVSKEILMHPDFIENLADELCEILEELMDEAFENDEIDFDFIDECADAINAIRSGDIVQILPVISRKEFFEKMNIKTDNKFRKVAIAAAVAALILFAGTQIKTQENVSVIQSLSGIISEVFRSEQITETTTVFTEETTTESETTIKKKETTTADITKEIAGVDGISVETTPDFRTEYYVGEKFSSKGLKIFAEYENGERKLVPQKDYTVYVSETFGTEAKYETVTIKANGFTERLTVRVIENTSTKKLNSIYAAFPNTFDFTAEDLENFRCDSMQVYALYSDGSERELKKGEYVVSYEHTKKLFKETLNVTVEYENCFCTFAVVKK
ncbi:MAG: bacterial Ig-like domain-containing protein [Clostridia bacterium]|nr:bacterial Ig-like domain-containing protein [Clostridia bacterium]